MLSDSDRYYLEQHTNPETPVDQEAPELLKALGKKASKKLLDEIVNVLVAARAKQQQKNGRAGVTIKTAGGKPMAAMTAAGAMEPVIGPNKGEIPSKMLRNSIHKIGDESK